MQKSLSPQLLGLKKILTQIHITLKQLAHNYEFIEKGLNSKLVDYDYVFRYKLTVLQEIQL